MKEHEPRKELTTKERHQLETDMLESFYICLSVEKGEIFDEHYKRIMCISKQLGGENKNGEKP